MLDNKIFFSIIVCCYNSEKYLEETIDSIINQSHPSWEIIIVNDGSTDNTENIIKKYTKKGVNIIYYYQDNRGFAAARNKAIELSNYEWIVIIDHDDICEKERLKIHSQQIINKKDCKLFFGDSIIFSINNPFIKKHLSRFNLDKIKLTNKDAYKSLITEGCFIDTETVVFNKYAANKIGNFNEKYKYIADYDFFIRMGKKYNFDYTKIVLSKWRIHDNQATKRMQKLYSKEYQILLIKNLSLNNSIFLNITICIKLVKHILSNIIK